VTSRNTTKKPVSPRAARPKKAPIGVLVLGMHRSGTSALTRVLNLLGCALPEALVGPSESNELGHWESASAVVLNDEILASAGSNWNDWGPINADWRASDVRGQMVDRATEVIREHKALGPLFALKDPRICRLADLWLDAADTAGVDMHVVLMLRHPGEVSASLESRDLMAPGYGQLLWLRHTLDAEHLSRGRKRVVCRFDRLLLDWQDTIDRVRQGLDLALPRNSPAAHAEVDRFLARDMRHHDAREDAGLGLLGASDWLRRTFEIMRQWSDKGEDAADHAELDRIRTEFDNAYPAFSRLLLWSGYSGEFAAGSRLRDQLQHQLVELSERAQAIEQQATEIDQLRARGNELEGKIAALTAAYETVQARSEELQREAAALGEAAARAAQLDGVVEALRQREGELTEEARVLAAARDEAGSALEALGAEVESLRAELTTVGEAAEGERKQRAVAEAELVQEKLANAELTGRIVAAESAAVQRQEELAQLWSQLEALQQAAGAAAAEIAAERERRTKAESKVAAVSEAAAAAAAEAEVERRRRSEAEAQIAAVREAAVAAAAEAEIERDRRTEAETRLAEAARNLSSLAAEKSELEVRVRAAEAAALERQQEVAQLWSQLGTVQQAAVAATAESAVERERRVDAEARLAAAMQDLRALGSEKGNLESRVRVAEMAFASQQDEKLRAVEQLAEAQSQLADLRTRLDSLQQAPARVRNAVFDELAQLTRLLQASETDAAAASAAQAAAERRVAEQTEELIRLSAMLSQEKDRAEGTAGQAEWLREMMHVAERMPKWWALMPEGWRRKREHEAYRRAGLFDAQQYLQNYPDVAADGMDPVWHYIHHGMAEGRQMWR